MFNIGAALGLGEETLSGSKGIITNPNIFIFINYKNYFHLIWLFLENYDLTEILGLHIISCNKR